MVYLLTRRSAQASAYALAPAPRTTTDYLTSARWRKALLLLFVLTASLAGAWLVLRFEFAPVILLAASIACTLILWKPWTGLCIILALLFLFEAQSVDPLMAPGRYLFFGLQSSLGVSGFILSPFELLLLLTLLAGLLHGIMRGHIRLRAASLHWLMLLFFVAILMGLARGGLASGDPYISFWEARALLALFVAYLAAAGTLHTVRQVGILTGIAIVAIGASAVEGAYRYFAMVATEEVAQEVAYAHDSVIFLGTLLLVALAQQVFGAPRWQRVLGLLLAPIALFTLLAMQRRAGYIALLVAFIAFAMVLFVAHRKAFLLIILPLAVAFAVYLPIFWNSTGLAGQPARAIRSMSAPDPRDAASNLYRDLEKINVIATIHSDPLLGIGFGREFLFVVPLPSLEWWQFWHYEPHHNILWVWLKTGAPGFILFWLMMGVAIARAARLAKVLCQRESRVFALLALAGIVQSLVFCYVDLGLTDIRVTAFLGTILGGLAVLDRLESSAS